MMKRNLISKSLPGLLIFAILLARIPVSSQTVISRLGDSVITADLMRQYIGFLASDSLKGRQTPGPGLDTAAAFIERQFRSFGLSPLKGSYFQELDYCYLNLGDSNRLSIRSGKEPMDFSLKTDFIPYDFIADVNLKELPVVFAGYGISAPEFRYDDYRDLDVRGKIVVVLRQEPGQTDSLRKSFNGRDLSEYSGVREKMKTAMDHGALALVIISGPLHYTSLKPKGYSWSALSRTIPRDILPVGYCGLCNETIPVIHAGEAVIRCLFGSADSLKNIQKKIERTFIPECFAFRDVTMSLRVSVTGSRIGGKNVIGFLEGSNPKRKQQVLVIGAHYDHVGFIREHKADTDYIFNGADDNASGTGGMLAIAKAFSQAGKRPERSVLFIAFAGEEMGLLGSATYVKDPLLPLKTTIAMLNLDMIGRNHPDSIQIIGARQNPGLTRIFIKQNRNVGLILEPSRSKRMGGGSDHYSFFRNKIPTLFLFSGLHPDYHQVGDNPDKINFEKAAKVSRLVFLSAWYIANDKHRYRTEGEEKE